MWVKIENDVFDIANRVKNINEYYEIRYNLKYGRYEIWAKNEMQLVLPYKNLDCRCLDYVYQTRIDNCKQLMEKIERDNKKMEDIADSELTYKAQHKMRNAINYLEKGKSNLPSFELL